jgi:hypothetical protein
MIQDAPGASRDRHMQGNSSASRMARIELIHADVDLCFAKQLYRRTFAKFPQFATRQLAAFLKA